MPTRAIRMMAGIVFLLTPVLCHAGTIVVNTYTDENDGGAAGTGMSLRDAVAQAAASDTITFDPALLNDQNAAYMTLDLGELLVTKPITIQGPGAGRLALDAHSNCRHLNVQGGVLDLRDITLEFGHIQGGTGGNGAGGGGGAGYRASGGATLLGGLGGLLAGGGGNSSATTTDSSGGGGGGGTGLGGAVYVDASSSFTAHSCTFSMCRAQGGAGGVGIGSKPSNGFGGAGKGGTIFAEPQSHITLDANTFTDCYGSSAGGTATDNKNFYGNSAVLGIVYTPFVVNDLGDDDDAIPGDGSASTAGGVTTLRAAVEEIATLQSLGLVAKPAAITFDPALFADGPKSIIFSQEIELDDGSIDVQGPGASLLTIDGQHKAMLFEVYDGAEVRLSDLTLTGGGVNFFDPALYNGGTITLTRVAAVGCGDGDTFAGVAWNPGTLVLRDVLMANNLGAVAGAILNDGVLYAVNSTFVENQCTYIPNGSSGTTGAAGAIYDYDANAVATIVNCTIARNRTAALGLPGGIFAQYGTLSLRNTIVAGGYALDSGVRKSEWDILGSFTGNANNLFGYVLANDGAGATDIVLGQNPLGLSLDEMLGPLADNGGPTQTCAVLDGSIAADAGNSSYATDPQSGEALQYDARGAGFPRIVGSAVDIGAFENGPDTTPPQVTVEQSTVQTDPATGNPLYFDVHFSERVYGFDASSLAAASAVGVSGITIQQTGWTDYGVAVALAGPGTVRLSVPAHKVHDAYNNFNTASTSVDNSVTLAYAAPSVRITTDASDPALSASIMVTVTFTEPVYGFDVANFNVSNATAVLRSGVSGANQYIIELDRQIDGRVIFGVPANIVHDVDGLGNLASTPLSLIMDAGPPVVTIDNPVGAATNQAAIPLVLHFGEPVQGFDVSKLSIGKATAALDFGSDGDMDYGVTLTPFAEGYVSFWVPGNIVQDELGNGNLPADAIQIRYDITSPTVTVTSPNSTATNHSPIVFTMKFSETIVDFDLSKLVLSNATAAPVSNSTYAVNLTPLAEGTVTALLPAGSVHDAAGNACATDTSTSIVYDLTPPVITLSSMAPEPLVDSVMFCTATANEPIILFSAGRILASGCIIENFTGGPTVFTFYAIPTGGPITMQTDTLALDIAGNAAKASNVLTRDYYTAQQCPRNYHSADTDHDGVISISELLREIQLYRAGSFHCSSGTEDGFETGPGPTNCCPHTGDYSPQNWRVDLSELLRIIQIYSAGSYMYCPGADSEDGFCSGK